MSFQWFILSNSPYWHKKALARFSDTGAASAESVGKRLRSEPSELAATVSCPGSDTAAITRGQAATLAAMVLSDLLARADA